MSGDVGTVLVLGADGLLGSHLVRQLLEREHPVRVFVQPGSTSPTLDGLPIEVVEGDLLAADGGVRRAVRGCSHVIHGAAVTDLWARPEITWRVNLEGTRRVVDACLAEEVRRLVFVGSASSYQFGSAERPGTEDDDFPDAYRGIAYMESKFRALRLVNDCVTHRGLDAITVAPTFLLGGLDWRPSSGELIRQFVTRKLMFSSPGGRNFAYAPDVARALVAAMTEGRTGGCYIAGGHNLSYLEFFTRVADAAGIRPPRWVLPRAVLMAAGAAGSAQARLRKGKGSLNWTLARLSLLHTYYSSQRAIDELGMPQTGLDQAIDESIASLRDYGHIQ